MAVKLRQAAGAIATRSAVKAAGQGDDRVGAPSPAKTTVRCRQYIFNVSPGRRFLRTPCQALNRNFRFEAVARSLMLLPLWAMARPDCGYASTTAAVAAGGAPSGAPKSFGAPMTSGNT